MSDGLKPPDSTNVRKSFYKRTTLTGGIAKDDKNIVSKMKLSRCLVCPAVPQARQRDREI